MPFRHIIEYERQAHQIIQLCTALNTELTRLEATHSGGSAHGYQTAFT